MRPNVGAIVGLKPRHQRHATVVLHDRIVRPNVALEQRDRRALVATSAPRPCHSRRLARELGRFSPPVNVEHIGPSPLASPEVVAKPERIKALNASCHRGRCPSSVVMGSHLPDRGPLWMHAIFRAASGREPDQQHTGLVDCMTMQGPRRSRSLQPLGQRCASSCCDRTVASPISTSGPSR